MHVTSFEVVITILVLGIAYTAWDERRQARRRREYEARAAAGQQRHDPPRNLAWPDTAPPGALFLGNGERSCGCVVTTAPDGVIVQPCAEHDPDIEIWEREIAE